MFEFTSGQGSRMDTAWFAYRDEGTGGDGDGDECVAVGDFCSENAECCSNRCKGKPGAKTCK
jgi:hypothetical protein